jgi:hypothetical protein
MNAVKTVHQRDRRGVDKTVCGVQQASAILLSGWPCSGLHENYFMCWYKPLSAY